MPMKPATPDELYAQMRQRDQFDPTQDPFNGLPADLRVMLNQAVSSYQKHLAYTAASEREFRRVKHLVWTLRSHGLGTRRIGLALGVSRQRISQLTKEMRGQYYPRKSRDKAGKVVKP